MSQETLTWLNRQILVGFTAKRGNAWHYKAEEQADEPNHYEGAIPVADVLRRLFTPLQIAEGTVETTVLTADGVTRISDPSRKSIVRLPGSLGPEDPGAILGLFKTGYTAHAYSDWLLTKVAHLLDADLSIGSAGLLKGGAVAWVQVELEETVDTPEGVSFRPHLSSLSSLDGSLSTTYLRGAQLIVCDNTASAALREGRALKHKTKHSRKSLERLEIIRKTLALEIIEQTAEDFSSQIADLCATTVNDKQWAAFLDAHVELPEKPGRGLTLAENKREALANLWNNDNRVAPWKNTAFGVLQAVNTFTHHVQQVRGSDRVERNAWRAITGGVDKLDNSTLETLDKVLVNA